MIGKFRKRMLGILVVCLCMVALSMYYIDSERMKNQIIASKSVELGLIQDSVIQSFTSVDRAYAYFDKKITSDMRRNSTELRNKYLTNPDVSTWDYAELKKQYAMDVYIVDATNTVRYSSFKKDIGLNFSECCDEFSNQLTERRLSGKFYHDGLDLQQKTGEIKKFSYVATPDKKYLIELGYAMENDEIFDTFNFLKSAMEIKKKYGMIESIRVYNNEGYLMENRRGVETRIDKSKRGLFTSALKNHKVVEKDVEVGGRVLTYRYVPYHSGVSPANSMARVVEIVYNNDKLDTVIEDTQNTFVFQLILIILLSVILANVSSLMVSHPMYLAFHDSLTGLRNRASYESVVKDKLLKRKKTFGVLLFDLDNFKSVNDRLGHDSGDLLLRYVANRLTESLHASEIAIRLGGDEFMVIMPNALTEEHLERKARIVMDSILMEGIELSDMKKEDRKGCAIVREIGVSMSVGGALYPLHGNDIETLYKSADIALYKSKDAGKNAYTYFGDVRDPK